MKSMATRTTGAVRRALREYPYALALREYLYAPRTADRSRGPGRLVAPPLLCRLEMSVGIALPKWIVQRENSAIVCGAPPSPAPAPAGARAALIASPLQSPSHRWHPAAS